MDVVILTTLLSQAAIHYACRAPPPPPPPPPAPTPPAARRTPPIPPSEPTSTSPSPSTIPVVDTTPRTPETVAAEIAALRAKATYTAEGLVAAARADRRANDLEAELRQMQASSSRPSGTFFDMLQMMQGGGDGADAPPHDFAAFASPAVAGLGEKARGKWAQMKRVALIRLVAVAGLYLYFRHRGDAYVVRVPCAALRPFAWTVSTRLDSRWTCAAVASSSSSSSCVDECGVSYYLFAGLTAAFLKIWRARFVP